MLHHRIIGKGRPVVWLHGYLESLEMWDVFPLQQISDRQHILIDLPGHGGSVEAPGKCSIETVAQEVWDTLDALGIADADLIGHSLGGYVLLDMHGLRPSKRRLCLFHSHFWPDDEQKKSDRSRVIELVRTHKSHYLNEAIPNLFLNADQHAEFVQRTLQIASGMDQQSIACYAAAMRDRPGFEAVFESFREQTLIIQGAHDRIIPLDRILMYREQINIRVLQHAGHMGHVEDHDDAWALLCGFLQNII